MRFLYFSTLGISLFVGCADGDGSDGPDTRTADAPELDDTAAIDDLDDDDDDDDPVDTGDPPDSPPASTTREICYMGENKSYTTCLDADTVSPLPADYVYPAPLNGSAQYREPETYLDLSTINPNLKLAPNFIVEELAQDWKGRYAVVQPHAVERLQDIRDELGAINVNSGYRNPDYNTSVGGATHSRHLYGDAFDLDPVSTSLSTLADTCEDHGAGYVGVYETHIHCDWRDDPMNDDFFGASWRSAFSYLPEFDAAIDESAGVYLAYAWGWDEGEPLREWTAVGYSGEILETHIGRTFEPPPGTKGVEVVVGRAVLRSISTIP